MIPVPEKKGSAFDRWYLDPECRIPAAFPISAWDDVKLYADFNKYGKVTFLLDGEVYHEDEFALDGTDRLVEEPLTPSKENYSFSGWYQDETMKEAVGFPVRVRESVTYYGTMTSTLTGAAFSPAGIIALVLGCAAILGAGIFLILRGKKKKAAG